MRHETISHYAPLLRDRYEVAASRADLLIFFYEQSVNLLKPGGTLTFITSNKYFRAGYGLKLRPFLSSKLTLHSLIDFGDAPVFDAIAYASILIGSKRAPAKDHDISVCNWQPETALNRLLSVLEDTSFSVAQKNLDPTGWSLEKRDSVALLSKLRAKGTPLSDYVGGKLYRGVITGFNEAFVIDEETRTRLITEDKNSAKLIKPFLRGRDVKRWRVDYASLYLIAFPFGFHKQLKDYPAILQHLSQFKTELAARGQCTSSRGKSEEGQHHWLELDNNPKPEYLACFDAPKIVVPAIERSAPFAVDIGGHYSNDKTSIMVCGEPHMLCAILNSAPLWWIIKQVAASKQNGYFEFKPMYVRPLPIPPACDADKARLSQLAEACAAAAQRGDEASLAVYEAEIDQIVYRLFDLTPDEIALIESALAPTRASKPSKRQGARAVATPSSPATAYPDSIPAEAVPASTELPATTTECSPAVAAWVPGELLSLEGELTPAKKARAAPKAASASATSIGKKKSPKGAFKTTAKAVSQAAASNRTKPTPISDIPRDEVMAAIRELFADSLPRSTETVVRALCQKFGHHRVSAPAREVLLKDLFTASRRQILFKSNELYMHLYGQIGDYDQESLKRQFLAAIAKEGRGWQSREEAIRLFARHLGFRRTGSVIEKTARSLITKLLKEGKLEKDGTVRIRRR